MSGRALATARARLKRVRAAGVWELGVGNAEREVTEGERSVEEMQMDFRLWIGEGGLNNSWKLGFKKDTDSCKRRLSK
jgi:hypothetical protein